MINKVIRNFQIYGVVNSALKFANKRKLWAADFSDLEDSFSNTSLSDSAQESGYLKICTQAALSDSVFKKFRSNIDYRRILEHVSFQQGQIYLSLIPRLQLAELKHLRIAKVLDSVGNPERYYFSRFGLASPTLLRYLKVRSELISLFGNLEGVVIAEIGIGFGGQAATINLLDSPSEFHLFDLPAVNELSERYLREVGLESNCTFHDGTNPDQLSPDLLISNYAFSELNRQVQAEYLNKLILRSSRGYITWNDLSYEELDGFSVAELLSLIPGSRVIPEKPLTSANNVVIVWGNR